MFDVPDWNVGTPTSEEKPVKRRKIKQKEIAEEKFASHKKVEKTKIIDEKIEPKSSHRKTRIISLPATEENGSQDPQNKLKTKLSGARFRYLNQKLYESSSKEALEYFEQNPEEFCHYHVGFREQTKGWPANPVKKFIEMLQVEISKRSTSVLTVVDMGCGEAEIACTFEDNEKVKIYSFDLAAVNKHVTVASMTSVPLPDNSVDIVIFSLSLMNTDYVKAVREANRILKKGQKLWIAEVASRLADQKGIDLFLSQLREEGFKTVNRDVSNKVFFMITAIKEGNGKNGAKQENLLKPCLYKKR